MILAQNASQFWQLESDIFRAIYESGLERYIAEMVPNIDRAFGSKYSSICCMDEGIAEGKVRITGSGILEPGGIEAIAKILLDLGVEMVTSHDECGGARLAYANECRIDLPDSIDQPTINNYAMQWAKSLADRMSELKREEVKQKHITIKEMSRPSGLHIARILYLNGTTKPLNPTRVIGLPRGYVISRRYFSLNQIKANVARAVSISMSDHGFGDRIDANNPFIIALVGDPNDQKYSLNRLRVEVKEIAGTNDGRVVVDGFSYK